MLFSGPAALDRQGGAVNLRCGIRCKEGRKRADLLVLDASPLDDIVNTRRISRVFIYGVEIDRAALRSQLSE